MPPAEGPSAARRRSERRARRVLALFGAGVPVAEIATRLSLRRRTVRGVLRAAGVVVDARHTREETNPKKGEPKVSGKKRIDLDDIEARIAEVHEQARELREREAVRHAAYLERRLEELAADGTVRLEAQRRGLDYGDCLVELAAELEARYCPKRPAAAEVSLDAQAERRLDRRASAYAERHGVPYEVGLEVALREEEVRHA
ncbi:MAG: hypothetical protein M3N33_00490 [Actinomycetota bacterium]|nr:hypothetical protein [Actinomycetota bacterium]